MLAASQDAYTDATHERQAKMHVDSQAQNASHKASRDKGCNDRDTHICALVVGAVSKIIIIIIINNINNNSIASLHPPNARGGKSGGRGPKMMARGRGTCEKWPKIHGSAIRPLSPSAAGRMVRMVSARGSVLLLATSTAVRVCVFMCLRLYVIMCYSIISQREGGVGGDEMGESGRERERDGVEGI